MNLKSKKLKEYIFYFGIILIFFYSIYLGFKYSLYNQDYHHSFFILSSIIDYKNGYKLFHEIFLQYGPGQTLFFTIISKFIEINIVSISQITVLAYSLNLILLFIIFKNISSIKIALCLVFTIFLIHPFSIYPWPDYLSGLSLSLFYYFFLQKKNSNLFFCSTFLFLAVFFRSTYLLNIFLAIFFFTIIFYFYKKKIIFKNIFNLFLFFISSYLLILLYFNNLEIWFSQSIGLIGDYAADTKHSDLKLLITPYLGEYGFIFLKLVYYGIRSFLNLFDFTNISNLIFLFFISINVFYLIKMIRGKMNTNLNEQKVIFVSVLGLFGFVQSYMLMELFRNINSMIGIFIVGSYLLKNNIQFNIFYVKYTRILIAFIFIFFSILIYKFPIVKYDNKKFLSIKNPFFSNNKKLTYAIEKYYKEINDLICKSEKTNLINISKDFAISYICGEKKIKNIISNYPFFMKKINYNEYERIVIDKNLKDDEILIVGGDFSSENLLLIAKFDTPHIPKNWYKDIYIYKKK